MSIEELEKVFEWLEKNMNKQGIFNLRLTSYNQISAFLKCDDSLFAQFYVRDIFEFIKEDEDE